MIPSFKFFHGNKNAFVNWLLLLALGLIWGMAFMGVEVSLKGFNPLTVATIRISLAAVLLNMIAFIYRYKLPNPFNPKEKKIFLHCFGMAVLSNAIPFSLLSWAQTHVSSGFAGIAMAVVPLVVLPLTHFLVPNQKMTIPKIYGFIIGFIGVVILIGPSSLNLGSSYIILAAQFACIIASCCYASGAIVTKLTPKVSLIAFTACSLLIASVIMIPVAFYFEGLPTFNGYVPIIGVIYLGLFPTALATLIKVILIRRVGPPFLSLVNYQVPIWAVLIGAFVLNESISLRLLLALVIILLGLAMSEFIKIKNS